MTNSYILLRNNKETGPFTFSQLQEQGIKTGDLLWVEGQSVAWMRPSELPEFRSSREPVTKPVQPAIAEPEKVQFEEPVAEIKPVQKSSVYVSLPAAKPVTQKAAVTLQKTEPVIVPEETPLNTKFERPLDEIKEMYVKTLEGRKKKSARKKQLRKNLKYAAIFIGLPLVGALLGITLQKSFKKKPVEPITNDRPAQLPAVVNEEPATTTILDQQVDIGDESASEKIVPFEMNSEQPGKKEPSLTLSSGADKPALTPDNKVTQKDPLQTESPATVRNENKPTVNVPQEELVPLVSVKSNNYKTGSFGGVRDLQLTVTNDSKYTLSHVGVELQYLKLGDELVKSEMINFHAVAANSSQTLDIPASKRGVKIIYKIRSIAAQQNGNIAGF